MSPWASRTQSRLFAGSTTLGPGTSFQCIPEQWWTELTMIMITRRTPGYIKIMILFAGSTTLGSDTSERTLWWHQSWQNIRWDGPHAILCIGMDTKYHNHICSHCNSNLIPGVNLLNVDWWVTRLGKGWPKKGQEKGKRSHDSDHPAWFKKNEDVPPLRIQESGSRS